MQLDNESLKAACAALRIAIAARGRGNIETIQAPLRALVGLEQAAFNAPQNRGWLRKRQTELREALDGWSRNAHPLHGADELQILYRDIAAILQMEPGQRVPNYLSPRLTTRIY